MEINIQARENGSWKVVSTPIGVYVPDFVPVRPRDPDTTFYLGHAARILRAKLRKGAEEWLQFEARPVPRGTQLIAAQRGLHVDNPWVDAAYYPLEKFERVHSLSTERLGVAYKATVLTWPGQTQELRSPGIEPGIMLILRGNGCGPVRSVEVLWHSEDVPPTNHIARCEQVMWKGPLGGSAWHCNSRLVDNEPRRQVAVDGRLYGPYCKEHGGYARALQEAGLSADVEPVEVGYRCGRDPKEVRTDRYVRA